MPSDEFRDGKSCRSGRQLPSRLPFRAQCATPSVGLRDAPPLPSDGTSASFHFMRPKTIGPWSRRDRTYRTCACRVGHWHRASPPLPRSQAGRHLYVARPLRAGGGVKLTRRDLIKSTGAAALLAGVHSDGAVVLPEKSSVAIVLRFGGLIRY